MKRSRASAASVSAEGRRRESPGAPPDASLGRLRHVLPVGAIALVGFLAYSNSFHSEFVFDDDTGIVTNELVRDLGNYLLDWAGYRANPNRYVGNLTLALNYWAGGLHVTGYHAVNVLIHLLNALLVYALVLVSFRTPHLRRSALASWSRSVAFAAALLFVSHPIQTQAVTYVVQRFTSLATTFYLLAVLLYARWRLARDSTGSSRAASVARYVLLLVSAILAMKTKEIAITLPIAVALYEVFFFDGAWRRRVVFLAPVLATLLVIPATLLSLQKPVGEVLSDVAEVTKVQAATSRLDYSRTELAVIATYLRLLVLPVGQNVDYDYPLHRSLLEPRVAASLLLILTMMAAALWLYGGSVAGRTRTLDPAGRLVSFGVIWFFLALSVESSVIPIVDVIFEHRVYLPSAGLFIAAATGLALLVRRWAPERAGAATAAVGVSLSLVLAAATFRRNEVWATELSLWTDVVSKSPGKSRPHDNLGLALAKAHREAEAAEHFRAAVQADPGNVRAHNNLGVALAKLGRQQEAVDSFSTAIRLAPDHAEAYHNLGRITLMAGGRLEEAAALFGKAIELRRNYPEAYANLAAAWNGLGRYGDTVRLLEGASAIVRDQPEAHYNLCLAYAALGNGSAVARELGILQGLSPGLASRLRGQLAGRAPAAR